MVDPQKGFVVDVGNDKAMGKGLQQNELHFYSAWNVRTRQTKFGTRFADDAQDEKGAASWKNFARASAVGVTM